MSVLIVDDRVRDIRWLTKLLTNDLGQEVKILTNEKDAKDHFLALKQVGQEESTYRLAILDIMMPVAKLEDLVELDEELLKDSRDSGIRLCKFIRQELGIGERALPIMALSSRLDEKLIREMDRLGIPLFSRDDLEIRTRLVEILG